MTRALGRVLVTGSSGFVGTNLMSELIASGVDAAGIDIQPPKDPSHRAHFGYCDITDRRALEATIEGFLPDTIFHLAARTDLMGTSVADYLANTVGVGNLISAARRLQEEPRVIFASTRFVFSAGVEPRHQWDYRPTAAYGESKVEGELAVRASDLTNWIIVRPTSLWGPWFDVPYRNFFNAIQRGYYFHIRNQRTNKAFGYVGNAVYQLIRLAEAEPCACRSVYWVSDYDPYRVHEWAEEVRTELAARKIRTVPRSFVSLAAKCGDQMQRMTLPAPITSFRFRNLTTDVIYDMTDTEKLVGPLPYDRRRGVERTVEWLRGQ